MSHRVKCAFGKKRCGSLRRTKTVHHKDKVVQGRVDGVRIEFQRHSMMLRSGRRLANAVDFEDENDDASDRVKETGNEAAPDWPTDVELDYEDSECKDYAKYNFDEEVDKNWLEFNAATDMADPKFEIGMLFSDCKVFMAAAKDYSILQNRDVVFIRNEALKLKAVCGDPDYGWMMYASKMQHENTLQMKTYVGEYTCTQLWENPTVKSTWISKKYVHTLKSNPQWPVRSFKQTVENDYNIGVSRQQVYRAKDKALKLIEGSFNEQYSRIWNYCEELRKSNLGTTAMVKCDFQQQLGQPKFQRLYDCLGAAKEGFKVGCRHIIGLDGCFLKSVYAGQLLTAVGIDANNETWVIAYAVVKSKCKESWIWFLELLVKDCLIVNQFGFTFISDKQKGLLPAFEQVVPNCDHKFCARHPFSNYRVFFKAKSVRDKFWEALYATTVPLLYKGHGRPEKTVK
ncbi:PREDICTED: uncharacterized protein LOC107881815 [Prunus mume]|uniref:Uncharacterized protein LOC107881815 n=1 Tax=Prunus mume TaxID=102107 RepID=A0ABM1LXK4_PRUMU|nr:PREDICTED: uncharacterized protein LOC107881815 [Prunus mume]